MFFKKQFNKDNGFTRFYSNLKHVLSQESWLLIVLWMIWLVGPVTYLSLQAGFYAGYGTSAPTQTFVYFAMYTLITAAFTILSRVFNNTVLLPRKQKTDKHINDTINRLFMIYFAARNEHLKKHHEDDRYIIAAWWHIASSATEDVDLQELIYKISGDYKLGSVMRRIEYYRSQGLYVLVQDEMKTYHKEIKEFTDSLSERFPALASYIYDRFQGIAPTLNMGHSRPAGFIDRLSLVLEKSNSDYATGDDMLSMLHLSLELLLGRSIITVYPKFNGLEKLEAARSEFDKYLSDFRLAIRRRNEKMISLIIDLLDNNIIDNDAYFFTRGAKTQDLSKFMLKTLAQMPRGTLKIQKRYEEIRKLNQRVQRYWYIVSSKEKIYNQIWHKDSQKLKERLSDTQNVNSKNSALHLEEHDIQLTPKQRYLCAKNILNIVDDIVVRRKNLKALSVNGTVTEILNEDDYKMIAAQIGNVFDDILNISEPEEQLAIDASKACDFGAVMPQHPLSIKINLAQIAMSEIITNRSEIAHRLASFLVQYLNITLGEHIINYLVEEYGASRDYLRELQVIENNNDKILTAEMGRSELIELPNWGYDLQQFAND
ncbi:MAG: hypothetical protein ACJARD_001301 [Alphaproteobacteria bacterium]|jgi:hypothetical protein